MIKVLVFFHIDFSIKAKKAIIDTIFLIVKSGNRKNELQSNQTKLL